MHLPDPRGVHRVTGTEAVHPFEEGTSHDHIAGSPWEGIADVADEVDAAVIVIGSRGLTGLKKVVETSVSQHLAEHARRPVLIVPPASHEAT